MNYLLIHIKYNVDNSEQEYLGFGTNVFLNHKAKSVKFVDSFEEEHEIEDIKYINVTLDNTNIPPVLIYASFDD